MGQTSVSTLSPQPGSGESGRARRELRGPGDRRAGRVPLGPGPGAGSKPGGRARQTPGRAQWNAFWEPADATFKGAGSILVGEMPPPGCGSKLLGSQKERGNALASAWVSKRKTSRAGVSCSPTGPSVDAWPPSCPAREPWGSPTDLWFVIRRARSALLPSPSPPPPDRCAVLSEETCSVCVRHTIHETKEEPNL